MLSPESAIESHQLKENENRLQSRAANSVDFYIEFKF